MASSRLLVGLIIPFLCSPITYAFSGFGQDVDRYIRESAQRYQISEVMLRGLVKMEDGWYGKISPTGPIGVGQFTRDTWNWLAQTDDGRAIGMRFISSSVRGSRLDPRHNKRINTFATALLVRWHIEQFKQRGIPITDENLYMAHNIGLDGFHRAILGRSTPEDIRNMQRNGMKRGMSVRQFIAFQKGRYSNHKYVANFMLPVKQQVVWKENTTNIKPTSYTHKKQQSSSQNMVWIEPSDNSMVWVEQTTKM